MIDEKQLECLHCKQPVVDATWNEAKTGAYCCYGCKVVDDLLHENGTLLTPGNLNIKPYLFLDAEKIQEKLLDFNEGNFSRITVHLPAIHCSSCIYLLESLPEVEEGILEVQVHFSKKQADITFKNDVIKLSQIAAVLNHIGYAPDFQTKLGKNKKAKNILLIQLGVAGFFFGNTMLLALPEYFDNSLATDASLHQFFRYLMFGFSLPVLVFSGRDYFINALKALRAGVLSIDFPIALGVAVLFLRSTYEVFSGMGSGYFDSLCGLIFFLLIGKWYQQKTYQNFTFDRDFKSFIPLAANLLVHQKEKAVPVEDLQKGDIVLVRNGEVLPADATLVNQKALLDYSYITGEALPVEKTKGDQIFAGAKVKGAPVQMKIREVVDKSYLSSLWNKNGASNTSQTTSNVLTDKIARYFTPSILLIAMVSALVWSTVSTEKAFTVFTAVLIVACPCALALAEPFAAGSMMRWFGTHGFFLKNAGVLNKLQEINYLVFDKTGTLTEQNSMKVAWTGDTLSFDQKSAVLCLAKSSTHPLSSAVAEHFTTLNIPWKNLSAFNEEAGKGLTATVENNNYTLGSAALVGIKSQTLKSAVYFKENNKILGYFEITQQTRHSLHQVIQHLQNKFKLALLSGDNAAEEKRFETLFGTRDNLHFNQKPHEKLAFVQHLQNAGNTVLMLGDGLNDAGALQQSNVGVSLCEKNVNFFPASDALLVADSFDKLHNFMHLSKVNKTIVYRAFVLSLLYNLAGLAFAIAGILSPLVCAILMPISSISVVVFTTLATRVAAKKRF